MQKSYIVAMQHDYLVCHLKKITIRHVKMIYLLVQHMKNFRIICIIFVKFLFFDKFYYKLFQKDTAIV